jgi:hypothetical protein
MQHRLVFLILLISGFKVQGQVNYFNIDSNKFNKPLMLTLDSLYQDDQAPRYRYLAAVKNKESTRRIDSLRDIMRKQDAKNLEKANAILGKYSWLGPQTVGMNASQGLFLVIQHADLATQQKYLPIIRAAEKKGEILSSNRAILEDRINIREGKKQVYGSQGFTDKQTGKSYIYPIADPDHVDDLRKSAGLEPMKAYVKNMRIEWDVEDYKKMLPEIEKMAAQHKL